MSGSRLGRGRGGRLAVYAGCGVVLILLVLLYRAATSEMARLRERHVQCAHQQESLAAQLQVIFEYKVRLEKSLAEEKSTNTALRQELQQRTNKEKNLRDKDSVEAMQRYNSLQQDMKLLQTEHEDLQEECKKQKLTALDNAKTLESTLQELRGQLKSVKEENQKELDQLRNKLVDLEKENSKIKNNYDDLMKNQGDTDSTAEHLKKEILQLKSELNMCNNIPSYGRVQKANSQNSVDLAQTPKLQSPSTPNSMKALPLLKAESSTKPTDKAARSVPKVRLPAGVAPIPKMMEAKPELDKIENEFKKFDIVKNKIEGESREKQQPEELANLEVPMAALPGRHIGKQIIDRQVHNNLLKVQPGVQEIGDEPNDLGDLGGINDGAVKQDDIDDDQYDNAEYDKEVHQKNNDIRIEGDVENEEDEEDQGDYVNNLKPDKHD